MGLNTLYQDLEMKDKFLARSTDAYLKNRSEFGTFEEKLLIK